MKIIAHRGNDNVHKENTLEAILNSLAENYTDGVEFDIRRTKDYKFVIAHDPFYKNYLIKNTMSKTLKKQGINFLEEVLKKINSNKIILIEIKEESKKYHILIAKLYHILKKYNLNYYIFSFNYDLVKYFKNKHPNFKVGILIGIKKNLNRIKNNLDFVAVNYRHANIYFNKETFIWTVNTLKEFEKIKPYQNIITDKSKYFNNLEK